MPVSHTDLSAGRFEHMAKYIRLQWKLRTKIIDFVIQTIDNFEEEKRIFGQKSEKKSIQQIEHNSLRISQKPKTKNQLISGIFIDRMRFLSSISYVEHA